MRPEHAHGYSTQYHTHAAIRAGVLRRRDRRRADCAGAGRGRNPDAELLTAFTEFELVGKRLRWINNAIPGAELSEAECRASLDRFYDLLARIAEMTPHTPEGWRAKTVVAYRALASTAPLAGEPLEREEQFALDTLLGLLGGAA
jgi:hypothetical protein